MMADRAQQIEQTQRAAGPEFAFEARLRSSALGMDTVLERGGARLVVEGDEARWGLVAMGRGGRHTPIHAVRPVVSGNVAEYVRAEHGVTEWFVNGPLGLEHGFDIARRSAGEGPLELEIQVSGSLRPVVRGDAIVIERADGTALLRYGLPSARDARGDALLVGLAVRAGRVLVTVDDRKAIYPLHIDPLIWREQAVVLDSASTAEAFGRSVTLDGDRLAVGGWWGVDAVSIFQRVGTSWVLEQRIPDPDGGETFGWSVALEGETLVIGAPFFDGAAGAETGALYVYRRSAGTWALEARLEGSAAGAGDRLGMAGVDFDRGTIVAASCRDSSDPGAVYVFDRSAGGWSETQRLVASDSAYRTCTGFASPAIDGDRLAVGASHQRDSGGRAAGAVFIFERSASGWTETARLDPDRPSVGDWHFGAHVALAGDLLVVSANHSFRNEVDAYRWTGDRWEHEGLIAPLVAGDGRFGSAITMSEERLVIRGTGPTDGGSSYGGQLLLYARSAAGWVHEAVLTPPPSAARIDFGLPVVALDGPLIAAGAYGMEPGRAFVFALRLTDGEACTAADDCHSGNCVDGVCCDTACGGGTLDCGACSVASGAAEDGVCGPLTITDRVCRARAGECDVEEHCVASSVECPPDAHLDDTTLCRPSAGPCDVEERCTGTAAACPPDALLAGAVCREGTSPCDVPERCDGISVTCPVDHLAGGETVCRAARFPCDAEERCDGASLACPPDLLSPDGAPCTDGITCNGTEICLSTVCSPIAALDCDDGDACTADGCAEPRGCTHAPIAGCCTLDADCEDGDECTVNRCEAATCVRTPSVCPDAGPVDGGMADGGAVFLTYGCGCHASRSPESGSLLLLLVLALATFRRRARPRGRTRLTMP